MESDNARHPPRDGSLARFSPRLSLFYEIYSLTRDQGAPNRTTPILICSIIEYPMVCSAYVLALQVILGTLHDPSLYVEFPPTSPQSAVFIACYIAMQAASFLASSRGMRFVQQADRADSVTRSRLRQIGVAYAGIAFVLGMVISYNVVFR